MYLVPMDIYNQVKDKVSTDDDIEITSINRELDKNDFFKETIKNEMKSNFALPPPVKDKSNTSSTSNVSTHSSRPTFTSHLKPSKPTPKTYICDTCGKVYKRKSFFKKHVCPNVTKLNTSIQSNSSLDESYPNDTKATTPIKSNSSLNESYNQNDESSNEKDDKVSYLPKLRSSIRNAHNNSSYFSFF